MKRHIYSQIIILFLLGTTSSYAMEKDSEDGSSTPTSQMITEVSEQSEQEEGSTDSGHKSPASSISSGADVADFSRDVIETNQTIFENVLQKACAKKFDDQDYIDRAMSRGLALYNKDRGRYSILLAVPTTQEKQQAQKACLNQLLQDIESKITQDTPGQGPISHPSSRSDTHVKRNIITAGLLCGVGLCCLATGAILVAAAWQSVEYFNN